MSDTIELTEWEARALAIYNSNRGASGGLGQSLVLSNTHCEQCGGPLSSAHSDPNLRVRITELHAALQQIADTPNAGWMIARAALSAFERFEQGTKEGTGE